MDTRLNVLDFLAQGAERLMLDVRSPGEYVQGHIPGAISFPLFTDAERATVGTTYKQVGKEAAMELGLEIVGPKMAGFVKAAKLISQNRKLALHCWRGGQRSGSMAWLFRQAGFDVVTLEGGYKAYRHQVLSEFEQLQLKMVVLGGKTGSGKTKILHALRKIDEQIIDLEGLAHHKGSAFGFIGEAPQPSVEQFENELSKWIQQLDPSKRVWVENESRSIGQVFIPAGFWATMKVAPLYIVEIPEEARIKNLLEDYVLTDRTELEKAFHKIASKLGGQHLKTALESLQAGDFAAAARVALAYYDKTYMYGIESSPSLDLRRLAFEDGNPDAIAQSLAKIKDCKF